MRLIGQRTMADSEPQAMRVERSEHMHDELKDFLANTRFAMRTAAAVERKFALIEEEAGTPA